jgi:hypothetical protein
MHAPGISGTDTMMVSSCGFLDLSSIPFFKLFLVSFLPYPKGGPTSVFPVSLLWMLG